MAKKHINLQNGYTGKMQCTIFRDTGFGLIGVDEYLVPWSVYKGRYTFFFCDQGLLCAYSGMGHEQDGTLEVFASFPKFGRQKVTSLSDNIRAVL